MTAALDPLLVPPRPWHTVGLDYLTHLHVSNGFDIMLFVSAIWLEWPIFCATQRRLQDKARGQVNFVDVDGNDILQRRC
jgi:hypothetical protein